MNLIKKAAELDIPQNVKIIIYGQAGMGKTTFALSSPSPLLFDFDNGVKRVNLAHLENVDIVQIQSWNDVKEVLCQDLSNYQTIVIDTIGKMMDFVIAYKCGNKMPTIKDWNGINQEFTWLTRTLSMLNKNIVFVAHRDSRKEGDDTVFVPALREKNYNSIVTDVDLLGYMEMKLENGRVRRTITFDPTNRNDGKNTCNLPSIMEIPTIVNQQGIVVEKNNFIEDKILKYYTQMLKKKQVERAEYEKVITEIKAKLDNVTNAESANDFCSYINNVKHIGSSKQMARTLFREKLESLTIYFNDKSNKYEDAEI